MRPRFAELCSEADRGLEEPGCSIDERLAPRPTGGRWHVPFHELPAFLPPPPPRRRRRVRARFRCMAGAGAAFAEEHDRIAVSRAVRRRASGSGSRCASTSTHEARRRQFVESGRSGFARDVAMVASRQGLSCRQTGSFEWADAYPHMARTSSQDRHALILRGSAASVRSRRSTVKRYQSLRRIMVHRGASSGKRALSETSMRTG